MKKMIILLLASISFILLFASCKDTDVSNHPTDSKSVGSVTNHPSVTQATENVTDIPSVTPSAEHLADIPADIEVVYTGNTAERELYEDIKPVETKSTVIVEAVPKEVTGQEVDTSYDSELKQDLPGSGYTKWEIEVTKVYKGDVKIKDKLVLLHDYYRWTYPSGKEQLISNSAMKPPVKDKKYLMFLQYDDTNKGYWPTCDYEGMFAIPTDEQKANVKSKTLKQSDLDVYNYEPLQYIVPFYNKVITKYFN